MKSGKHYDGEYKYTSLISTLDVLKCSFKVSAWIEIFFGTSINIGDLSFNINIRCIEIGTVLDYMGIPVSLISTLDVLKFH